MMATGTLGSSPSSSLSFIDIGIQMTQRNKVFFFFNYIFFGSQRAHTQTLIIIFHFFIFFFSFPSIQSPST